MLYPKYCLFLNIILPHRSYQTKLFIKFQFMYVIRRLIMLHVITVVQSFSLTNK